jgi:hypothetical protein
MKVVSVMGMFGRGKVPDDVAANKTPSKVRFKGEFKGPRVLVKGWGCDMSLKDYLPFWSKLAINPSSIVSSGNYVCRSFMALRVSAMDKCCTAIP